MLMIVAFLFGLVAVVVGFTFAIVVVCENWVKPRFGHPRSTIRRGNRRFYNPHLCPVIERLEPIVLLADTTWTGGERGDFGDNTQWNNFTVRCYLR